MSGFLQKPGTGGSAGVETVNGLTGAVTLSAGTNIDLNNTGNDIEINANFTQQGKYMISGGAVWSGTGLTYDVSIISYFFNGVKSGSQASITLDPSDPTLNRLDSIVIDEAGTISVITGVPSASPATPPIPEDQLEVQIVLVEAGSTTPTIQSENIYLDNPTSDWTFSTYTTGTATGSIDFAGTNSPKQGVNDIEASTDARLGARFVRGTSFDAFQYTMLQVWVRFTGTAVATNKSLNVRFENSAGTLVGNTVNLFSYGLSRSILNTWQLVVVPITAFGALPATVKGLKMIMAGGTVGVVRQWDIDYMILTNGSVPYANVPTIAFYKDDVGIASQSGLNLIEGTGVTIDAVNNPLYNRVDYTINSSGGLQWYAENTTAPSVAPIATGTGSIALGDGAEALADDMFVYGNLAGQGAGATSTKAFNSNFLGAGAGQNATNASFSNFFGDAAGQGAIDANNSNFFGGQAGTGAINASNSIFIGNQAGSNDTVDNYNTDGWSILLGPNTNTGGFSNSILLGGVIALGAISNTKTNQFMLADSITDVRWSGIEYTLPNIQGSAGDVLANDGTGILTWAPGGSPAGSGNQIQINQSGYFFADSTFQKSDTDFNVGLDHTQQSAVTFTGSGLDDLTVGGTFSGTYPTTYTVTIDGVNQEFLEVVTSTISGGSFAVSDTVTNGTGGSADIVSISVIGLTTFLRVTINSGSFASSDVIDNGSGVTGTLYNNQKTFDTITYTDGVVTETNVPTFSGPAYLVNGILFVFGAETGHTLADEWTWTYSYVNQNVLDFSNNDYKFQSTFGTNTFGYQISDNIFGYGLKGSVNTWVSGSDLGIQGIYEGNGFTILANALVISGIEYGNITRENGQVGIGNLAGGNNTKITIDDVNETMLLGNLKSYDDDIAAGVAGLTTGMIYQTTGSGSAPLNVAGIIMAKQ